MHGPIPVAAFIMLLMTLLLQGCGHKGPLYLPQTPAAPQTLKN